MSAPSEDNHAYVITFHQPDNMYYTSGIPTIPEIQPIVYRSLPEAKKALMITASKFDTFTAVAYGKAYPYENTSFDIQLNTTGFALLGWIVVADEDESVRLPFGLTRLSYSG
jgi:hypothetical protein